MHEMGSYSQIKRTARERLFRSFYKAVSNGLAVNGHSATVNGSMSMHCVGSWVPVMSHAMVIFLQCLT